MIAAALLYLLFYTAAALAVAVLGDHVMAIFRSDV